MRITLTGKWTASDFDTIEERFEAACKQLHVWGGMSYCKYDAAGKTVFEFDSNADDVTASWELAKRFAWHLGPLNVRVEIGEWSEIYIYSKKHPVAELISAAPESEKSYDAALIVRAVNCHEGLVVALKDAEFLLSKIGMKRTNTNWKEASSIVDSCLRVAGDARAILTRAEGKD